jgi:hypothetical protein
LAAKSRHAPDYLVLSRHPQAQNASEKAKLRAVKKPVKDPNRLGFKMVPTPVEGIM